MEGPACRAAYEALEEEFALAAAVIDAMMRLPEGEISEICRRYRVKELSVLASAARGCGPRVFGGGRPAHGRNAQAGSHILIGAMVGAAVWAAGTSFLTIWRRRQIEKKTSRPKNGDPNMTMAARGQALTGSQRGIDPANLGALCQST